MDFPGDWKQHLQRTFKQKTRCDPANYKGDPCHGENHLLLPVTHAHNPPKNKKKKTLVDKIT
jgi:hypothetical protein